MEKILCKIKFKRVFIVFFSIVLIAGVVLAGVLINIFKDKISLVYNYAKVRGRIEETDEIQELLADFAVKSSGAEDIIDIIVAGKENEIIYSAKKSALAEKSLLNLHYAEGAAYMKNILTDPSTPGVYYRFIDDDLRGFIKTAVKAITEEYDYDYYDFFINKKISSVYILSCIANEKTGCRVYFIFNIKPVINGKIYLKIIASAVIFLFMVYWVLVAVYVYADSVKSKLNGTYWGLLTLLANIIGLAVYVRYKQRKQSCYKCGAAQEKENIYCVSCGVKLNEVCPDCGKKFAPDYNFCGNCGASPK